MKDVPGRSWTGIHFGLSRMSLALPLEIIFRILKDVCKDERMVIDTSSKYRGVLSERQLGLLNLSKITRFFLWPVFGNELHIRVGAKIGKKSNTLENLRRWLQQNAGGGRQLRIHSLSVTKAVDYVQDEGQREILAL